MNEYRKIIVILEVGFQKVLSRPLADSVAVSRRQKTADGDQTAFLDQMRRTHLVITIKCVKAKTTGD
jgi:hypothetical protein